MDVIENRTFDEIEIGDTASLVETLTREEIQRFAAISGDVNPTHLDDIFASSGQFHKIVGHGMWCGSMISNLLGTRLPGPGTVYRSQNLSFIRPVGIGDAITVTVRAKEKKADGHRVVFDCTVVNQNKETVVSGTAEVTAPTEKYRRQRAELPQVRMHERGARFRDLIERGRAIPPARTAVVHPVDEASLLGAVEAARAQLIVPVLVGPEARIRDAAKTVGVDISACEIVACEHSHHAAERAVELARAGQVEMLMKGALHTDELMAAVVSAGGGLRTERRISHVFIVDVPTYPRPLFITDAAINIYPNLEDKRDIVQNAIDLAVALGIDAPRVAILSAVETVTPKIPSTMDAAALCKMADRGQITGGRVDGPLAFDNAVSEAAAETKGIVSDVAGRADILVVPDLEAGNMLAKQLSYLANAESAGVVLGARVPIVLTSRADSTLARMASCAVALCLVDYRKSHKIDLKPEKAA